MGQKMKDLLESSKAYSYKDLTLLQMNLITQKEVQINSFTHALNPSIFYTQIQFLPQTLITLPLKILISSTCPDSMISFQSVQNIKFLFICLFLKQISLML